MMRTAQLCVAAVALTACGPAQAPEAKAPPKPHKLAPLVAGPLPAPPAWAQPFMGKIITQALPQKETCLGNADHRLGRYAGPPAGIAVGGWGWDKETKQPVSRVLLTDETLRVWGAGEGVGGERLDVPNYAPEVQSRRTGWRGVAAATSGLVVAWGLIEDGKAICPLGEMEL